MGYWGNRLLAIRAPWGIGLQHVRAWGMGCPLHIFTGVYRIAVKGHACSAGARIYRFTAESVSRGVGPLALPRRIIVICITVKPEKAMRLEA